MSHLAQYWILKMWCEGGSVTSDDVVEALLTPELWADLLRSSASWKE